MPPLRLFGSPRGRAFTFSIDGCHKRLGDLLARKWPTSSPARVGLRSGFHTRADTSFRRSLHTQRPQQANILTAPTRLAGRPFSPFARSRPHGFSSVTRRFNSTGPSQPKPLSFSQRMRKLSREYGWSALGIYLFLSALDFPFCFAAVRLLGVERIGHWEHVVVDGAKRILGPIWPQGKDGDQPGDPNTGDLVMTGSIEGTSYDHGVVEAEKRNTEEGASIWTQLALAYAIHKSFIFIRVPLTAAITPKIVRVLRRWGWDIGKRKPKSG